MEEINKTILQDLNLMQKHIDFLPTQHHNNRT